MSAIMYSGSAECVAPESIAKNVPLMATEASRQGQTNHTADGGVIKNKGEKTVTMYSETGDQYRARYQITDVTRPLNFVSRVCVIRETMCCSRRQEVGSSITRLVGIRGFLENTECMCCTHGSMDSRLRNVCDGQVTLSLGRSAGILRFRGTRGTTVLCKTSLEQS